MVVESYMQSGKRTSNLAFCIFTGQSGCKCVNIPIRNNGIGRLCASKRAQTRDLRWRRVTLLNKKKNRHYVAPKDVQDDAYGRTRHIHTFLQWFSCSGSFFFFLFIFSIKPYKPFSSGPELAASWCLDRWDTKTETRKPLHLGYHTSIMSQLQQNFRHVKIMPFFAASALKLCFDDAKGVDYLKYDNCNNQGMSPQQR